MKVYKFFGYEIMLALKVYGFLWGFMNGLVIGMYFLLFGYPESMLTAVCTVFSLAMIFNLISVAWKALKLPIANIFKQENK